MLNQADLPGISCFEDTEEDRGVQWFRPTYKDGKMLTLYVFPCDCSESHDPERAKASFGDVVHFSQILKSRRLDLEKHFQTPWYGYVFSDEYLDDEAKAALPTFLAVGQFGCLILMKKVWVDGEMKVTQAPRIFRKHVRLTENTHVPENPESLIFERMLNGWVRT